MRSSVFPGLLAVVLLAGCTSLRSATPVETATTPPGPTPAAAGAGPVSPPASPGATSDVSAKPKGGPPPSPVASGRPESLPAAGVAGSRPAAGSKVAPEPPGPIKGAPAKPVSRPVPATTPPSAPALPVASSRPPPVPGPPALDLAALEQRLRDTRAVGVFTKLSLKNQVDDLLSQVRSYYRDRKPPPPAALRPRFDGLVLKVLSVVQDGDASLAAEIWSSREAIWGVLADPAKLDKI